MSYFKVTNPLPSLYSLEDPRGVIATLLIGSTRALLIDTATGIGDMAKEVRLLTNLPITVVNTHGHVDHTSGNYQFPEVYLAKNDWEIARVSSTKKVRQRLLSLSAVIPTDFDEEAYFNYRYDNLVPLENGTVFDLGGISVRVINLPAHTPGSMGFLCPEINLLFSGDSIAPMVCLVFPESSDLDGYVKTLESVKELPFSWILSAHSDRLIPKEEIELYLKCAKSVEPEETLSYRSPLFPEFPGRMYSYKNPEKSAEYAIVVCSESKFNINR